MGKSKFIQFYATMVTLLAFGFIYWASFFHDYSKAQESMRIIDTAMGFLFGVALAAIINFFFGSSQGSADKQEQMERLMKGTSDERQVTSHE